MFLIFFANDTTGSPDPTPPPSAITLPPITVGTLTLIPVTVS